MAMTSEETFEKLLARIARREQTARRRAILYSFLPIAVAIIILGYTAYRIQSDTVEIRNLEGQIYDLQTKVQEAEARLGEATDLGRYIHPVDPVDAKMLASLHPREARVLQRILRLRQQGVKWRLGGQSPAEGFDSPSFATFILRELNLPGGDIRPGESLLTTSRRLRDRLPEVSKPEVGDLSFYPAGYVLFYFKGWKGQAFVIGMTPFGITALKPDFAKVIGHRRARP